MNDSVIRSALSHVRYPGTGQDIVTSGMLSDDIVTDDRKVSFSIIFKKQNDPFMKSVLKAAESAIHTYVGSDVVVEAKGSVPQEEVKASEETEGVASAGGIAPGVSIIAVSSGKGGVGKSSVAANLAVALAQSGYKVGLLDADIFGPSQPKMFNVEDARPRFVEIDGHELIAPIENYGVRMLSIGFFIDPAEAIVWRGGMASNALKQLISDAYWGDIDYFLIDMPPGTSDIHLTTVQTLALTGAVVVTTPQEVALADARKGISMFTGDKVGVPVLGIVENMSWFTPSELPDNKYYIFGRDGGRRLAEETGVPLLGQIPIVQSICEGSDNGRPVALNPDTITGKAFRELAEALVRQVDIRNEQLPPTEAVKINRR